jgi:hypothetical protein
MEIFKMRKLILIAALATMSTTSCYANLSLASNQPAPAAIEQPKADQTESTKSAVTTKSSTGPKAHKPHMPAAVAYPVYQVHGLSFGHCL